MSNEVYILHMKLVSLPDNIEIVTYTVGMRLIN